MSTPYPIVTSRTKSSDFTRSLHDYFQIQALGDEPGLVRDYYALDLADRLSKIHSEALGTNHRIVVELGRISDDFSGLISSIEDMSLAIDGIVDAIECLSAEVKRGFLEVVENIVETNNILEDVSSTLKKPGKTLCDEKMRMALAELYSGMKSDPAEEEFRVLCYKSAYELFGQLSRNPIGKRTPRVWSNIAWLEWKLNEDIPEAIKCFKEYRRLCRVFTGSAGQNENSDANLVNLAYLLYLNEQMEESESVLSEVGVKSYFSLYLEALIVSRRIESKDLPSYVDREATFRRVIRECLLAQPLSLPELISDPVFSGRLSSIDQVVTELAMDCRDTLIRELKEAECILSDIDRVIAENKSELSTAECRGMIDDYRESIERYSLVRLVHLSRHPREDALLAKVRALLRKKLIQLVDSLEEEAKKGNQLIAYYLSRTPEAEAFYPTPYLRSKAVFYLESVLSILVCLDLIGIIAGLYPEVAPQLGKYMLPGIYLLIVLTLVLVIVMLCDMSIKRNVYENQRKFDRERRAMRAETKYRNGKKQLQDLTSLIKSLKHRISPYDYLKP